MLEEHRQEATRAVKKLRSEVASAKKLAEQKDFQLLKVQANVMEMCGEFANTAREEERIKYAPFKFYLTLL